MWFDISLPIKVMDILTLSAIIFGPIIGIYVSKHTDKRHQKIDRRLEIFKVLMRTRNSNLSPEHVGALNLIEIEFYKEDRVLKALEDYFQHLNDYNDANAQRWTLRRPQLFTRLLSEIAKSLGYEIEQLQILGGGYAPQGWIDLENRQIEFQKGMISLLKGEIGFPVTQFVRPTNANSNFPPPPKEESA